MLLNLKNYKLAKLYAKDIVEILKKFDAVESQLKKYANFKPVSRVLSAIRDERAVLIAHRVKFDLIVKTKGQVKDT